MIWSKKKKISFDTPFVQSYIIDIEKMKWKKENLLLQYYFLSFSNGLNQNPANMYKI